MKMTMSTASTLSPQRIHRKVLRAATKRLTGNNSQRNSYSIGKVVRNAAAAINGTVMRHPSQSQSLHHPSIDPCENSNDSGLGFDHHMDYPPPISNNNTPILRSKFTRSMAASNNQQDHQFTSSWQQNQQKKSKLEIKMESDDSNDNFNFPENINQCKETTS